MSPPKAGSLTCRTRARRAPHLVEPEADHSLWLKPSSVPQSSTPSTDPLLPASQTGRCLDFIDPTAEMRIKHSPMSACNARTFRLPINWCTLAWATLQRGMPSSHLPRPAAVIRTLRVRPSVPGPRFTQPVEMRGLRVRVSVDAECDIVSARSHGRTGPCARTSINSRYCVMLRPTLLSSASRSALAASDIPVPTAAPPPMWRRTRFG